MGAIIDPIVIDIDAISKEFLNLQQQIIPPAFTDWETFGAPDGAPHKNMRSSLSLRQHELIGWILSIHFVRAAELVAVHLAGLGVVGGGGGGMEDNMDSLWKKHQLPAPQSPQVVLDGPPSKATSMMYGIPETDDTRWSMNPIHCRTSFEPTVGGTLHDSIISGAVAEDIDLMFPKGPMIFNTGWTLDLGPTERYLMPYNFGYLYFYETLSPNL